MKQLDIKYKTWNLCLYLNKFKRENHQISQKIICFLAAIDSDLQYTFYSIYRNDKMIIMKERERFFWQLLLQLLPSAIPAAITILIGVYRDLFPTWAFVTLIIILTLFLFIALTRLVLGDLFTNVWVACKRIRIRSQNHKLIISWQRHWDSMCDLFIKCIDQPQPPTDEQEDEFRNLHEWFVKNRANFLPIWHSFSHNRTQNNHESWSEYDPRTKILYKNYEDPFSVIYQATSLKSAIISLGVLTGGVSHWLNEYQDKFPFKHALKILQERIVELLSIK